MNKRHEVNLKFVNIARERQTTIRAVGAWRWTRLRYTHVLDENVPKFHRGALERTSPNPRHEPGP